MKFKPVINDQECTMNTEINQCCCTCEYAGLLLLPDNTHLGYVCTKFDSFVFYFKEKHRIGCEYYEHC